MLIRLLFLLACVLLTGPALAKDVQLYFIGGQSNGTGRGDASAISGTSPLASAQTDVGFWYSKTLSATNNTLSTDTLIDLAPGSGHGLVNPVYSTEFGPELGFGRTLADALPDQNIVLVKATHGGSNLHTGWAAGGSNYTNFINTANAAIDAVELNGDNPILMGMIWVQGESDTGNGDATNYGTNLTNLISRVRTDLFGGADAPFVFSQLSDNQYNSLGTGVTAVRAGQLSVSQTVANTAMVVTDDDLLFTTRSGDRIHFDANGQINLGNALGAEMVALVPEPSSLIVLGLGGVMLLSRRRRVHLD